MAYQFRRKFNRPMGGRGKIVLPTRFLLGGNINDPLNLNSLADDEINKLLNAPTPVASPATAPVAYPDPPIAVNRPINFSDPLNLSACDSSTAMGIQTERNALIMFHGSHKKRRRFKKKLAHVESSENAGEPVRVEKLRHNNDPLFIDVDVKSSATLGDTGAMRDCRRSSALDKIVSPAIPQMSPRRRKRRRTSSEGRPEGLGSVKRVVIDVDGNPEGVPVLSTAVVSDKEHVTIKSVASNSTSIGHKFKKETFKYGNYCAYYGYRNACTPAFEDARLQCLPIGLFEGKDVLDIGCNVGHVTLKVARDNVPRMIIGVDIDPKLIASAKKNIRHYMSDFEHATHGETKSGVSLRKMSALSIQRLRSEQRSEERSLQGTNDNRFETTTELGSVASGSAEENIQQPLTKTFPVSMALMYGPIASHSIVTRGIDRLPGMRGSFPHNVMFQTENYVPETDESLLLQQPEYDVILALSVTKWMHLNNGDSGLKRAFLRMYKQLRPGGRLVLEPQEWPSYRKKKKLTEEIFKVYQSIKFRPTQFRDYLLSDDVGFLSCEVIGVPYNKSKGFQRSILIFTKR